MDASSGVCEFIFRGHAKDVKGLSISHDGKLLASASTDGTLRVWDLVTNEIEHVLQRRETGALCVAWSPDGIHLAAGYISGYVRL